MANNEHLSILMDALEKKDIEIWNQWRQDNRMKNVDLRRAKLIHASLTQAKLSGVYLSGADLFGADLTRANLTRADLTTANLTQVNFFGASLEGANLSAANLTRAKLEGANLEGAFAGFTLFTNVDLSTVERLATVEHGAPSSIGTDTLYLSKGKIPIEFLEGCGVPEPMITYAKSLVGQAIEYYSCFISYNSQDEEFAKRLAERMKSECLRVWFAPDDIKGGRKIHEQVYEAIRYHDKLIIVLSEDSMNSNWVETEIRRARKRERDEKRQVLFPIRLVDYESLRDWQLFDADEGRDLAQEIREYFIPDFSNWKNHDSFTEAFDSLVADLRKGE